MFAIIALTCIIDLKRSLQTEYTKDAEKSKHDYNLPADAPQFVKAKEVADNVSDVSNENYHFWFGMMQILLQEIFVDGRTISAHCLCARGLDSGV